MAKVNFIWLQLFSIWLQQILRQGITLTTCRVASAGCPFYLEPLLKPFSDDRKKDSTMDGLHVQVETIADTGEIETSEDHGVLHIEHEIKNEPETITTETDDAENINLKVLCK